MTIRLYHVTCVVALFFVLPVLATLSVADDGDGPVPLHKQGEYPRGWVDWLEDDQIVIEDTQYTITSETRILDKNSVEVGIGHLNTDMWVVFEPGEDYKLLIIQEMSPDDVNTFASSERDGPGEESQPRDTAPVNLDAPEGIYKEGGVWKN